MPASAVLQSSDPWKHLEGQAHPKDVAAWKGDALLGQSLHIIYALCMLIQQLCSMEAASVLGMARMGCCCS